MLSFQCPPLPVRGTSHENEIINSHDMLAIFTSVAFQQQNAGLNEERRGRQEQIRNDYRQKLITSTNLEQTYNAMCSYTKQYLGTYLNPPFTENDIHMLPMDHMDRFKQEAISYSNALSIIHERPIAESGNIGDHIMNCANIISAECKPTDRNTEPVPMQSPATLESS